MHVDLLLKSKIELPMEDTGVSLYSRSEDVMYVDYVTVHGLDFIGVIQLS